MQSSAHIVRVDHGRACCQSDACDCTPLLVIIRGHACADAVVPQNPIMRVELKPILVADDEMLGLAGESHVRPVEMHACLHMHVDVISMLACHARIHVQEVQLHSYISPVIPS